MERARQVGLALIGVLAVGAATAASAHAAFPEFEKVAELETRGGPAELKTAAGAVIKCTTLFLFKGGTISTPGSKKAKKVLGKLENCKTTANNECKTQGSGAGEITFEELEGEIGYIKPVVLKATIIAFALSPSVAGSPITKFKCREGAEETKEIKGCVIGELSKANELTGTFSLLYEELAGTAKLLVFAPTEGTERSCEMSFKTGAGAAESVGIEMGAKALVIPCPGMERIND